MDVNQYKDDTRAKSGLDMSHILEEPELDKTGILQGAKWEMSSEAVREWNNENNQTEVSAQPLSNAKVKN